MLWFIGFGGASLLSDERTPKIERLWFEEPVSEVDAGGLTDDEDKRFRLVGQRKSYGEHEYLLKFCRAIARDVRNDYDCVVVITGEREGIGKSMLALQCSMILDKRFRLDRNVVYDPNLEAVTEKLTGLPKYTPIVFDEAVKVLFNREWYSKSNIFLNKYYKVSRKFNQISFMVIPDISDVDKKFLQTKVMWWLHVIDRGLAVVRMRDWLADAEDKWHFGFNKKMAESMRRRHKVHRTTTDLKLKFYKRSPNYVGYLTYPDLPARMKKQYRALSEEASRKFEFNPNKDARVERYQAATSGLLEACVRSGLKLTDLTEYTGLASSTLGKLLKERGKSTKEIRAEMKKEERLKNNPLAEDLDGE